MPEQMIEIEEIERRFTYHQPKDGQPERYSRIRVEAKKMALHLINNCPSSRELSLSLTKLDEAVFWANAAIARREP